MTDFKITKLVTGADQKSYFEQTAIDVNVPWPLGLHSHPQPVREIIFRQSKSGSILEWSPAPTEFYLVYLKGEVEVEASGGEKKRFGPGDVLLVQDTTGQGHRTIILTDGEALIIPLNSDTKS